jgi:hypothetical protein
MSDPVRGLSSHRGTEDDKRVTIRSTRTRRQGGFRAALLFGRVTVVTAFLGARFMLAVASVLPRDA